MADTEQDQTATEPWDAYDETSAEDLVDAASRKRSPEKLQEAIDYEKAHKNRVTVITAFEDRLSSVDHDTDDADADVEANAQDGRDEADSQSADEARAGDVTAPAGDQDTSGRKTSGQIAAREADEREQQRPEINEKAEKAAAEGGVTPAPSPGPVYAKENRQDRVELAGHEYRVGDDVEPDPAYRFDLEAALNAPLVDHIAVAAGTEGMYLEIDGRYHRLDVQSSVALARLTQAASVPLNN